MIRPDARGNLYVTGYFTGLLRCGKQQFYEDEGKYFFVKYAQGDSQKVLWAKQLPVPIKDLVVTPKGIYIFGQYQQSLSLEGQIQVESQSYFSSFVAHYSPEGALIWTKNLESSHEVLARKMVGDQAGNLILLGTFTGDFKVDKQLLRPQKRQNLYLLKCSPEGEVIWAQTASGGDNMITGIYAWALSINAKGQVFVAGSLIGRAYFSGTLIRSSRHYFAGEGWVDDSDVFLAKYSATGKLIWAKNVASRAEPEDIACDENGSVYMTGYFKGSENPRQPQSLGLARFGDSQQLRATFKDQLPSEDLFLAKYSPLGNLIWVKQGKGEAVSRGISLGVDTQKDLIYVAGFFTDCLSLEKAEICTDGRAEHKGDIYLACFQANGKFCWIKQGGGRESDDLSDLSIGQEGQVYITGRFRQEANFGNLKLLSRSPKGSNAYIVKY